MADPHRDGPPATVRDARTEAGPFGSLHGRRAMERRHELTWRDLRPATPFRERVRETLAAALLGTGAVAWVAILVHWTIGR